MYEHPTKAGRPPKPIEERFWKYVNKTETCWEWTGNLRRGYGRIDTKSTHRFSYELHNGPIPEGSGFHGTCVCHTCDNRKCVRPDHLFLGTAKDNIDDMMKKKRQAFGSKIKTSKLTLEQVQEIRRLHGTMPNKHLAQMFSISTGSIERIAHNRVWKVH